MKLGRPDRAARAAKKALAVPGSFRKAKLIAGGYLISSKDFENFRMGLKACRQQSKKAKIPAIFQYIRENYYHRGFALNADKTLVPQLPLKNEMPTLQKFRHWYQKEQARDPEKAVADHQGQRSYELDHRPLLGDASKMAFGPGSIFQIDATTADIYLVSSLDRTRIVGRPTLYLLIDVFSHLIVGFHVTLAPSSYLAAILGIENALSDKVSFCAAHGITIQEYDWPCHYKPEKLLADRGELEGYQASGLVMSLDVRVLNTAPYRADLKAIVERRFRSINDDMIHWLDGAVIKDRERGEHDYRLDSMLTLHEFRKLMIYFCLDHNRNRLKGYRLDKDMMADGVQPYPNELWAWGIKNRSGHLRVEPDLEIVHTNLLPFDQGTITQQGIRFKKVHYTCDLAIDAGWFVGGSRRNRKVTVHYDPRITDVIYIRPEVGARLIRCVLTEADQRYAGCDWSEVKDILTGEKDAEADAESSHYQSKADFHANIKSVVDGAEEKKNADLKIRGKQSKRSRIKDIKANQRAERKLERQSGTTLSIPSEPAPGKIVEIRTHSGHQEHAEEEYVPPPSRLDRLSKIIEKQQQQLPLPNIPNDNA